MVEFGDDLIIESYKIPWLIWIQLLVMILLIILLLFGFTLFTSDPTTTTTTTTTTAAAAAATATSSAQLDKPSSSNNHRRNKVEDPTIRRDAETSGGSIREDDNEIGEESSLKEPTFFKIFQSPNHPCNYFRLARQAFLKCFGLDSSSESSNNHQHDKQE